MTKKILLPLVALLVIVALCYVCFFSSSTSDKRYTQALPDDAVALVAISPARMMSQMDLQWMRLQKMIPGMNNGNGDANCIDLTREIYFFVTENEQIGVLAGLDDSKKFAEICAEEFDQEPQQARGLNWIATSNAVICWDEQRIVAIFGSNTDDQRLKIDALMSKETAPDALLTRLAKANKPLAAICKGSAVANLQSMAGPYMSLLPINLTEYDLLATLDTDNNKLLFGLQLTSENDEAMSSLNTMITTMLTQYTPLLPRFVDVDAKNHSLTIDVQSASALLPRNDNDFVQHLRTLSVDYDMEGLFTVTLEADQPLKQLMQEYIDIKNEQD